MRMPQDTDQLHAQTFGYFLVFIWAIIHCYVILYTFDESKEDSDVFEERGFAVGYRAVFQPRKSRKWVIDLAGIVRCIAYIVYSSD